MGALYWCLTIDERDGCFEDLVFVIKCLYSEYDVWIIGRSDPANSLLRDNPCSDERLAFVEGNQPSKTYF